MSMTKEKLRNELVAHGVPLPSQSAKKGEYVKLFEEHVAPLQQREFSSDEETSSPPSPSKSSGSGRSKKFKYRMKSDVTEENSLIVEGLNIQELSDDELFDRLKEKGVSVGPIVDSTRKVYQRKLAIIMRGGNAGDSLLDISNGDVDLEGSDAYSDSDLEEGQGETASRDSRGSHNTGISRQSATAGSDLPTKASPDLRRRVLTSSDFQDSVSSGDRHTPTPRRALHSTPYSFSTSTKHVTETIFDDYRLRENQMRTFTQSAKYGKDATLTSTLTSAPPRRSWLRLLLKILIVILFCLAVVFVYQNWESESPYMGIEEAARKAADAVHNVIDHVRDTQETPKAPPVEE